MTDTTPTVIEANCTTGEVIERPMTTEELAQRDLDRANSIAQKAEQDAAAEALATLKSSARAKLVDGTPLTEEEAAVLVI